MPPPAAKPKLRPGVARRLATLRKLSRKDTSFMALVDMYRNVTHEPEEASYFMAWHDWEAHGGTVGAFDPWGPGYDERELEFLAGRGVKRAL